MKIKETLHFSKTKYRQELWDKNMSHVELAKAIYRKRCKKLSAKVSTGASVAAAVFTGGHSLVASAYSGRNISVESQKLEILEEEWERRGHPPLPPNTLKDKVLPITVALGASVFTFGLDAVLANAAPDQFYQFVPDPEVNKFLIANVYYKGVESGARALGNMAVKRTVSRAPQSAYDADRREGSGRGSKKADDSGDEYGSDEKYSDDEYGSDEKYSEEESEEDSEEEYEKRSRYSRRYV